MLKLLYKSILDFGDGKNSRRERKYNEILSF
jgi:hypothetical protein